MAAHTIMDPPLYLKVECKQYVLKASFDNSYVRKYEKKKKD